MNNFTEINSLAPNQISPNQPGNKNGKIIFGAVIILVVGIGIGLSVSKLIGKMSMKNKEENSTNNDV